MLAVQFGGSDNIRVDCRNHSATGQSWRGAGVFGWIVCVCAYTVCVCYLREKGDRDENEAQLCSSLRTFTCTVKSSCSWSLIRSFNWTTVLVPGCKCWARIDLLSDSTTVGGNMPRSAGCYWTLFQLVTQATNKSYNCRVIFIKRKELHQ